MYANTKLVEEVLRKRLNRDVEVYKESIYAGGELSTYGRIYIDGRECPIRVDFYDLTEYNKRGMLLQQLNKLANKIEETL